MLTLRELNRATLARQLLLRRHRQPVPRALERTAGLQAQFPPSPYIGLWSRLEGFRKERLSRALERASVVKATLMRMTLHLVSADDYVLFAGALKEHWIAMLERRLDGSGHEVDVDALVGRALALASETPRRREDILQALGAPAEETPWFVWSLVHTHADLVHGPESAAWRWTTGRTPYVAARAWLRRTPETSARAAQHLVRSYFAAFGPATRADLAQWSGAPLTRLQPALAALEPELRTFRDERGQRLLDLRRAPRPDGDTPAPVRFLPKWDNVLLAHQDRSRILDDRLRSTVIRKNGDVLSTFLVDGFVAGAWRLDSGRVVLEPFGRLDARTRGELEAEAERLAAFVE